MNDARAKVEEFKKKAGYDVLKEISWNISVEKKGLDYHSQLAAESIAFDNEVAKRVGVTLTDHETWPEERSKISAKAWAQGLPDA